MTDIVPPSVRSRMMSGIRGRNTKPEVLVRKTLFAAGYRFRLHRRDLPGSPDIVLPSRKVAIFVHGCFWHMHTACKSFRMPSSRPDYWREKLESNVARDTTAKAALHEQGWRILVVWECATRASSISLSDKLSDWIEGTASDGEISVMSNQ